jgi:hypothetical protein
VSAAGRLGNLAAVLGAALETWDGRDDATAQPGVRQAANTAVGAIDGMLAELHQARSRLVSEIRRSDDATMARVDAMLAGYRAREAAR